MQMRLFINIDHVATVRQARRTIEPDPVRAAVLVELGGADGITVHLREDRRHIQDRDVELLMRTVRTGINLEIAAVEPMVELALGWRPAAVTLVPEKREEITTEGGLSLSGEALQRTTAAVARLRAARIRTSLFIDPEPEAVRTAAEIESDAVELHTGDYAHAADPVTRTGALDRLGTAAELAHQLGLSVHAGHGLTYENVAPVAAIPVCEELNIGHSVVSRSLFSGLEAAVREMRQIVSSARRV
jgi:pyridoxine 5-phosphate synthase